MKRLTSCQSRRWHFRQKRALELLNTSGTGSDHRSDLGVSPPTVTVSNWCLGKSVTREKVPSVAPTLNFPSFQKSTAWAPFFWHGGNYQDRDPNLSGFEQAKCWTALKCVTLYGLQLPKYKQLPGSRPGSYTPHRTETLMFRRHGWEEEEVFLVLAGFAPTLPELERRQA